jgi:cytochrome c7-like protein
VSGLRRLARYRRGLAIALVEVAAAVCVATILIIALPGLNQLGDGSPSGAPPSPGASGLPSGLRGSLTPMGVLMGPDADCGACHVSPDGGIGAVAIPALAHPLEGWGDCTACHADDRLVQTAPGHSSLHRADCLVCHKAPVLTGSPPPRPHHIVTGEPCISCHDNSTAPLPTDMAGRTNCWICHSGTEFNGLFGSPSPSTASVPP